ncbi:GGDEF domain-containing response regulator [Alteromonas sp. CYL-A6]|uniref:GGDEF domain-containing response regulator n=1 Tax=Alteromonas nitratireducens TaxID=3390813 RepID=UPI0034A7DB1C
MQEHVLVIESSEASLRRVSRLVHKAGLTPVGADSLTQARQLFEHALPESFLCAIVTYALPDAPHGEAIDFTINAFLPTIAVTDDIRPDTRSAVLSRPVIDYVPKENAQNYDYLFRLLHRLQKNKHTGVMVVSANRSQRAEMSSLLLRHNFVVYEASNAKDALAVLADHPHVRLVITSSQLPDTSGSQFVASLRKAFSKEQLGIIGIADNNSSLMSAHFIKSGANDFLRAPYCVEEALCRIMQNVEYMESVEAIRRAANTDYLTGLPNRRHFFYSVNLGYQTLPATHALALLDLDFFKQINDTHGHDAGDAVLKAIARHIKSQFADVIFARFGGEEFCLYFPNIPRDVVMQRLEAFRQKVEKTPVKYRKQQIPVTTSIGVSFTPSQKIEDLLKDADLHLYEAKHRGRNQICCGEPLTLK